MGEESGAQSQPTPYAWGSYDQVSEARRAQLDALAERQREWVASAPDGQRDLERSAFKGVRLTGAEVFYLAARALAGPKGDVADAAEIFNDGGYLYDARDSGSFERSPLHLEGANLEWAHLAGAVLASAHLEGALLERAHLERADLEWAHLERAFLNYAQMEDAELGQAHLEGAQLDMAQLLRARLGGAHLEGANLSYAHLRQADLSYAHLEGARLDGANLERARLQEADLDGAHLNGAHLERAFLSAEGDSMIGAHLEEAELRWAHLEGAGLRRVHLEGAFLWGAHLEGADLGGARLEGADLTGAFLDTGTALNGATLSSPKYGNIHVADTRWGGVNLATVAGALVPPLGDESMARSWKPTPLLLAPDEPKPTRSERETHRQIQVAKRMGLFQAAVRANRQLAVALQDQGMSEEAARFAYRAQVCQRTVLRLQGWRMFGSRLFSGFLDTLAGYGYRPGRTVLWYLAIVLGFAAYYVALAPAEHIHLTFLGALVLSVSSFHGRGFFPGIPGTTTPLDSPLTVSAAGEAIIGLLIEISFIATFTQRYFGAK